MKDKIKNYLGILIFATLFLVLYWLLKGQARYILIYFLIPAGLFISFNAPFSLVLFNFIGLVLLFISGKNLWWLDSWVLVALFMVLGIFPFYSRKIFVQEEKSFSEQKDYLTGNVEGLKNELTALEKESKGLQNEVERITRLYLLGREFVEQMDMKETIDHLKISIFDRNDIKSVSIFAFDKQSITPIYLSKRDEITNWSEFAGGHQKTVAVEKSPKVLSTPSWLKESSVILWPIKIEEEINVAIFFAVNTNFVDTCIEEGKIFIPQIALGFKRIRLFEEVRERSRRDGLTGLYLRRYFIERLEGEIQRAKRYSSPFSMLMIDIDLFKNVNDIYGHLVGDATLRVLSQILSESVRPGDLIGRYGGEEFVVLLPLTTIEEASKIANRLNKIISEKDFLGNYRNFKLTVSIGISHYPTDGDNSKTIIEASDKALYWVKMHGRNGVKEFNKNIC